MRKPPCLAAVGKNVAGLASYSEFVIAIRDFGSCFESRFQCESMSRGRAQMRIFLGLQLNSSCLQATANQRLVNANGWRCSKTGKQQTATDSLKTAPRGGGVNGWY